MRAIVLASTALALCLSGCDVSTPSIGGAERLETLLATTTIRCRDPRGRYAKCQLAPSRSRRRLLHAPRERSCPRKAIALR
jgi:hypothetical protein